MTDHTASQRLHLNPVTRIREFRRTCWQVSNAIVAGSSSVRLADQVISLGQCLQRKWELVALMARVRRTRPEMVVEIGTYRGGTLRCWAHVCPKHTTMISIDLPGGAFGGGYSADDAVRFKSFCKPGQTLHSLRADSHADGTRNDVIRLLDGRPIDFLFIDGDHSYEGVKADFEIYGPQVRRGGTIALHDILPQMSHADCRVHQFWAELTEHFDTEEYVDRDGFETWGGIGVVIKS
jgi:predicted O-methyltransferase YrrM